MWDWEIKVGQADLRKYGDILCVLIIPFPVPRMSGVTTSVPKSLSINVSSDVSQPSQSGNGRAISYDEKPQDYIKYL